MLLQRLSAFVLLLALAGGVLAGTPLHSEQKCPLAGGAADCCATARMQSDAPAVGAARLCCALNCTAPGSSGLATDLNLQQFVTDAPHDTLTPRPLTFQYSHAPQFSLLCAHPAHSPPTYIRHLVLLI